MPSLADLQSVLSRNDLAGFRAIFLVLYVPLYRYAMTLVRSSADAEDIVQDLFTTLWCGRATLQIRTASLQTYLFPAVRNRCFDFLRKRQVESRAHMSAEITDAPAVVPKDVVADAAVRDSELRAAINAAIADLPERRRQSFVLRYIDGMPERQVAETLHVRVNTVHTHVRLALATLRTKLAEYQRDH
jgi:RNA polymerase sigma-70 factor (ECF subfamily)